MMLRKKYTISIIILITTIFYTQISFSSGSTCFKEESYNKGYQAAFYDISKGNWKYTILGLSTEFMVKHESIKKEASRYGLKIGMKDELSDNNEFCFGEGYNEAVRKKLKEKYGFDVIKKVLY